MSSATTRTEIDRIFAALADSHRRDILDRVSSGPVSATALAEPLGMTVTGLLRHVHTLEEARLVTTYKAGTTRWCRLAPDPLDVAATWIATRGRLWQSRLDAFEAHLHGRSAQL